jgi:hypothetical protein
MILIQPPVVQNWNSLVNKPSILSDNQISWDEIQNKPTTLTGYGITNGQPLGNELTALQSLADIPGFLKKTGDGTYSIDVSNYLPLSGGNVGIGTTAPEAKLEVQGTTKLADASNNYTSWFPFIDDNSYISGLNIILRTNPHTERMRINSAGLVGIGLNNPSTKLQVAGTITTTDMIVSAATPSTSPTTGASRVTGGQGVQGNQYVGGFSSLGGDANHPGIKIKVLTGTTAATQGGVSAVAHGVVNTKIVSISVIVGTAITGHYILPSFRDAAPGYCYEVSTSATEVVVYNHPTNSYNILSKLFIATIIYTA